MHGIQVRESTWARRNSPPFTHMQFEKKEGWVQAYQVSSPLIRMTDQLVCQYQQKIWVM